jgi:hypothetical protein
VTAGEYGDLHTAALINVALFRPPPPRYLALTVCVSGQVTLVTAALTYVKPRNIKDNEGPKVTPTGLLFGPAPLASGGQRAVTSTLAVNRSLLTAETNVIWELVANGQVIASVRLF